MQNYVLFILLSFFASIANSSSTTENQCNKSEILEAARLKDVLRCDIECRDVPKFRSNSNKTNLNFLMRPTSARFDEDPGKLELRSWVDTMWIDEDLKWNKSDYGQISTIDIRQPDIGFLSIGNDNIYKRGGNRTKCGVNWDGFVNCEDDQLQTIRCQTDFTLWPYGYHKCTVVITSWFFTTEQLVLTKKYATARMYFFKSHGHWNLTISRVIRSQRKSLFYDNVTYPQISIEFVVYRINSQLRRRFVGPILFMMVMTLTTLWLEPKSYARFAVASLNILIHLLCLQNLHWVLPRSGTTIPNILLFYINSFVLATVALLLTLLLEKMNDTKISVPKWILSNIDRFLTSKVGQILLLDPKVMATIETGTDDKNRLFSSEPKKLAWKNMALILSWISFFSIFFTYILMYILLVPNSPWKPITKTR